MLNIAVQKRLGDFALDLNFSIASSGITVVFGKSGAGKTTVLNLLAGLLKPDAGVIHLGGKTLFDSRSQVFLQPEKRGLGYVFQEPRLFSHMSVKTNLLFSPRFCGRKQQPKLFDRVVDLLGIGHLLERRPNTLSGGEAQRVAIGRALLASSSLLLMDEPLSSLDQKRKDELIGYITMIPEQFQLPIIYVTHSLTELSALADNALLMRDGGARMFSGKETIPSDIYERI